ncbi:MAG: hypothetical protein AUI16_11330 [Alphaproteobacteria bacterium 13_2_20CM_2_64_7]|jgi:hypothetical protein|nr:MAG: hypothetical protein AUI16_11330 [Alphaproteobacteria bacterium 13_2_20CM_2_64_7]
MRGRDTMAVEVDKVQQVNDGYGFNIKANRYRWMTLIYETEAEAQEGRAHALKAVEKATSAVLPK